MDGAGREEYNAQTETHIQHHAERLRISFDDAAEIYERGRREHYDALAMMPTPEAGE
jgi:hypothetical protein